MAAGANAPTSSEYIVEHLTHLTNVKQGFIIDMSVVNWDTLFWSISMGVLTLFILIKAASKASSGVPGRFQAAIEMLVEMVESQSKGIVHGDRSFIAPLALTVFVWVFFMNAIDFIPVDWVHGVNWLLGAVGLHVHVPHHRATPQLPQLLVLGRRAEVGNPLHAGKTQRFEIFPGVESCAHVAALHFRRIGHGSEAARINSKSGSSRRPSRKPSSMNDRNQPRLTTRPNTNQRVWTFCSGFETRW